MDSPNTLREHASCCKTNHIFNKVYIVKLRQLSRCLLFNSPITLSVFQHPPSHCLYFHISHHTVCISTAPSCCLHFKQQSPSHCLLFNSPHHAVYFLTAPITLSVFQKPCHALSAFQQPNHAVCILTSIKSKVTPVCCD